MGVSLSTEGFIGGSSKDATPPVISNVNPPNGTPLGVDNASGRMQPVSFDITDLSPGIQVVVITCKFTDRAETLLVFNGTSFVYPFNSAQSSKTSITNGFHFQILQAQGWESSIENMFVYTVDQAGNLEGGLPS